MSVANKFWNSSVRFDSIIWLASNVDQPCEAICDLVDDGEISEANFAEIFKVSSKRAKAILATVDTFMEWKATHRIEGFLVYASTPIPTAFFADGGGHSSCGFGMTTGHWFYFETLDAASCEAVFAWQKAYMDRKRTEFFAKQEGKE